MKIAECYGNKSASADEVEGCAQNCSNTMRHVQSIVQNELNQFQGRIERCTMQCQDEANGAVSYGGSTPEAAQAAMLKCATKCVDTHVAMLRSIQAKLERDIDSVPK